MEFYYKLVKTLKSKYSEYKVSIRRKKLAQTDYANCWFDKKKSLFSIKISSSLEEPAACDSILHEFAHVLSWDEYESGIDHGPKWSAKYRQCYKIYEKMCQETH